MIHNRIQDEFLDLQIITFPIDRGNKSVADYLDLKTFKDYLKIIENIDCLKNDVTDIRDFCSSLVDAINHHNTGEFLRSYKTFYEALDKVKHRLYHSYIENTATIHGIWKDYHRIRKLEQNDSNFSALEMLHVPFNQRELASSSRYSMSGFPCSYLSNQDFLPWLECERPARFALMTVGISPSENNKHKLLRLDFRPHEYFRSDGFQNKNQEQIKTFLINLCYTIPLTAACSFICKHNNSGYKEEYLIPQLLISWIKERASCFIGVRYNSISSDCIAPACGGINIAIPIRVPGNDGYCTELRKIFDLKNATITYHDLSNPTTLPTFIKYLV